MPFSKGHFDTTQSDTPTIRPNEISRPGRARTHSPRCTQDSRTRTRARCRRTLPRWHPLRTLAPRSPRKVCALSRRLTSHSRRHALQRRRPPLARQRVWARNERRGYAFFGGELAPFSDLVPNPLLRPRRRKCALFLTRDVVCAGLAWPDGTAFCSPPPWRGWLHLLSVSSMMAPAVSPCLRSRRPRRCSARASHPCRRQLPWPSSPPRYHVACMRLPSNLCLQSPQCPLQGMRRYHVCLP
jgi:hypothetical protein